MLSLFFSLSLSHSARADESEIPINEPAYFSRNTPALKRALFEQRVRAGEIAPQGVDKANAILLLLLPICIHFCVFAGLDAVPLSGRSNTALLDQEGTASDQVPDGIRGGRRRIFWKNIKLSARVRGAYSIRSVLT
jgi:hypothetical protein